MASPRAILPLLVLAVLAAPAWAKTYCCKDEDGRRVCGDTVPPQCRTKAYQELNAQGVARQVEAPLTTEQRAQRDAELARKKEEERLAAEEARRGRALLASYPSEKDIDAKRDRMLAEVEKGREEVQARRNEALKRKAKLDAEAEFYLKKPMPDDLKSRIRENQLELSTQQTALEAKKQEMESIRARFEDDKRRYLNLTRDRQAAPAAAPIR